MYFSSVIACSGSKLLCGQVINVATVALSCIQACMPLAYDHNFIHVYDYLDIAPTYGELIF